MMQIAALDDDPHQLDLLSSTVAAMGHSISLYSTAHELQRQLRLQQFDLLLIDWELPEQSGIDVIKWVREELDSAIPIIMLTHRNSERDVVTGLSAGADDYMQKPLRVEELKARIMAICRRTQPKPAQRQTQFGGFALNPALKTIRYQDEDIILKEREFDLALCLLSNTGRVLTRQYLMETLWGMNSDIPTRTLDTHISTLRSKLHLRPERGFRLSAVYGHGYRLDEVGDSFSDSSS
ncbi:response regulator transcription factor [Chitinibacter sp. FCG-7]|uniref:Response regulator transcription factor n=1 Tax=Chitinibacter mangrovi TaxID=3153927 RepID=A0AAU7FAY9_9NEIS